MTLAMFSTNGNKGASQLYKERGNMEQKGETGGDARQPRHVIDNEEEAARNTRKRKI